MTADTRRYISDEHFEMLVEAPKEVAMAMTSFPGHPVRMEDVLPRLNFQQRYRFLMETGKFKTTMSEDEEKAHCARLRGERAKARMLELGIPAGHPLEHLFQKKPFV